MARYSTSREFSHIWETLLCLPSKVIALHGIDDPFRNLGSATVVMLRYGLRFGKDINIFLLDPYALLRHAPTE